MTFLTEHWPSSLKCKTDLTQTLELETYAKKKYLDELVGTLATKTEVRNAVSGKVDTSTFNEAMDDISSTYAKKSDIPSLSGYVRWDLNRTSVSVDKNTGSFSFSVTRPPVSDRVTLAYIDVGIYYRDENGATVPLSLFILAAISKHISSILSYAPYFSGYVTLNNVTISGTTISVNMTKGLDVKIASGVANINWKGLY